MTIDAESIKVALDKAIPNFIDRASTWLANAEIRYRKFQEAAGSMRGVHLAFLRDGYLPTGPLHSLRCRSVPFEPAIVATEYARQLEEVGLNDRAEVMRRLSRLVAVGDHEFSVRSVFPEIEKIARDEAYGPGVTEHITSLPSIRIAMNEAIFTLESRESHAIYSEVDTYVLTALSAFDYAYSATTKQGQLPKPEIYLFQRCFRKVPNRHKVCHALPDENGGYSLYDSVHVVNALSLLYTMAKIGALFRNSGYRVAPNVQNVADTLEKWRDERRQMNHINGKLWRLLSGKAPKHSVPLNAEHASIKPLSPEELLALIPKRESPIYLRKITP